MLKKGKKSLKSLKVLLVWGSKGKRLYMEEFAESLKKLHVECKLVNETDFAKPFPSKKMSDWFRKDKKLMKLLEEFKPDAVFVDRQAHVCVNTIKEKFPVFVFLRGQYWSEIEWAKKTLYKDPIMRKVVNERDKIANECFSNATAVLPICKYLEKIVKKHHPDQQTHVLFEGIHASNWYKTDGMKLQHPCVGLVQDANWWGKTKEMLILKKVMDSMPKVNFYWAGGGLFADKILEKLDGCKNFHYLGRLSYPDKVRDFLSEIDIYSLISGMDLGPRTLNEAQLMKKPIVASNVGGIPELIKDGETGFLVEEGNVEDLIEKLNILLNDKELAKKMGEAGRKRASIHFSWENIAKNFIDILNSHSIGIRQTI